MEVLYKRCCGIDIHKNMMVACIFTSVRKKEIRQFSTITEDILQLVSDISNEDSEYIEFMMHSSEFMPGGSPYYKTQEDINRLYSMLDILFQRITTLNYEGSTLRAIGAMVEEGEINV